jgi:hypothetical protein
MVKDLGAVEALSRYYSILAFAWRNYGKLFKPSDRILRCPS